MSISRSNSNSKAVRPGPSPRPGPGLSLARIIHEASRTGFMDVYFCSFLGVIEM